MATMNLELSLNDMAWNDLKKYAKEQGVKVTGTRDEITKAILVAMAEPQVQATLTKVAPATESKLSSTNLLVSPTLKMPKRGAKSTAKKSLQPNDEKIVFTMPKDKKLSIEPENLANLENVNSNIEGDDIQSPKKELFPPGFTNAGPLSPQIHRRASRKPILRSPSPVKADETACVAEPALRESFIAPNVTTEPSGDSMESVKSTVKKTRATRKSTTSIGVPKEEPSVASTPANVVPTNVTARTIEAPPTMVPSC